MINHINSWAQGIILAVIIATIIEIILPDGKNKKYVKVVIGIYILFVILYPLVSKKEIDIESIINYTNSQINKYETSNNIVIETNTYVEETYEEKISEDIKKNAKQKGYNIDSLKLYIETADDENYGKINSISMQISKINSQDKELKYEENSVNNEIAKVENVEIKISNSNTIKNSEEKKISISEEELESFKEYLGETYGTEKEKIYINN